MSRDTHVTVAVVVERDGRFLLVEEGIGGNLVLNQPAGHWEDGESFVEAAAREALEETGWTVRPTQLLGLYEYAPADLSYGFLRIAYVAEAVRHDPALPLDRGIARALWMTPEEIAACPQRHRSPMVMRCIEDYRRGRRYPLDLIAHLPGR